MVPRIKALRQNAPINQQFLLLMVIFYIDTFMALLVMTLLLLLVMTKFLRPGALQYRVKSSIFKK